MNRTGGTGLKVLLTQVSPFPPIRTGADPNCRGFIQQRRKRVHLRNATKRRRRHKHLIARSPPGIPRVGLYKTIGILHVDIQNHIFTTGVFLNRFVICLAFYTARSRRLNSNSVIMVIPVKTNLTKGILVAIFRIFGRHVLPQVVEVVGVNGVDMMHTTNSVFPFVPDRDHHKMGVSRDNSTITKFLGNVGR